MPSVRLPIVGNYYKRGPQNQELTLITQNKDRRFVNAVFTVDGEKVFAEKRPGFVQYAGLGTTSSYAGIILASQITSSNTECLYNVNTSGAVNFIGNTSFVCGTIASLTGTLTDSQEDYVGITETILSGTTYTVFTYNRTVFFPNENGIFYHPFDATVTSVTGNRTSGSPIVSGIASTAGLYSGQLVTATGFAVGTRILTVDSGTQITLNANASSGAATSTTLTIEPLAKVLDTDLPTDITGNSAALDGYLFVMTRSGRIYNSDINSVTSWSASGYITANTNPDKGVGVVRAKNLIVGFGKKSIEFFYNAGNPSGSPLSRIDEATILMGCTNPNCIVPDGDDIYFVGASNAVFAGFDPIGVYILRERQIKKISLPSVDMVLSGGEVDNLQIFRAFGKRFVVVNFVDTINPHVYDIETGIWSEWQLGASADVSSLRVCAGGSMVFSGSYRSYMPDGENVNFTETFQDSTSKTYTFTAQSEAKDFDTGNLKAVKYVELVCDKQASGTATLEYSDDEYGSWVTADSTFDLTQKNPRIPALGAFTGKRAWRITHSANTRFRCSDLVVNYTVAAK